MATLSPDLERLLAEARGARARGQADEERRVLERAVAAFPDHPQAQNTRGLRALADGDLPLAVSSFARAAALDPGEPALCLNLAAAHRQAGDQDGEAAALRAALDIDRRHFLAQLRLAELRQRQGSLSEAAQHWAAVVQLAGGMDERPPLVADGLARGQRFLDEHNAAFARELECELSGDPTDALTERRFGACVDVMLRGRRVYRNECHGLYYPFLPADEYFDRDLFPWFEGLEARTPAIRGEALALLANGSDAIRPYVRQDKGTPQNKWSALDHSHDWSACFLWEYGIRNDPVCALCPETAAALEAVPRSHVPGKAPSAFFSILQPGAHIPPHTGVTNTRAIIHLPLVVPDGCTFRVGGETRPWVEGHAFAFDDTIEHEAWNRSDQVRILLILDVWNPHLSEAEQERLIKLFAVADRGLVAPRAG
ncbi:aspartyl/asparaginyl beta-hydroxylase domain-containing protein [Sphingomonas sp. BN140010]|uniref:Aspartyl/asparaginyl beta-hydroxylase domain-containing protein n=1 Tax=Sphingomonas arvum TaxID=2992113 RepID=A0ABT3JFV7_9SPHN|nr:aspartyl/asparaginyl beta-hydroxylase domain-containing protein [Sphingomonas sp. BN140010]MCW3797961.1 aspartyl/asparaginyl beta-hydroxylase domain-containing protein [Sphingomonas sp. BN140010]